MQLREPFAGVFVLLATSGAVSAYCLPVVTVLVLGIQINLGQTETVYSNNNNKNSYGSKQDLTNVKVTVYVDEGLRSSSDN